MLLSSQAQAKASMFESLGFDGETNGKPDTARRITEWTAEASKSLLDSATVGRLLDAPERFLGHERFYFEATIFGHHLVRAGLTIERALRDCALRLLLARRLGEEVPESYADHPAATYPLTIVESMMRGQGIERYMGA